MENDSNKKRMEYNKGLFYKVKLIDRTNNVLEFKNFSALVSQKVKETLEAIVVKRQKRQLRTTINHTTSL